MSSAKTYSETIKTRGRAVKGHARLQDGDEFVLGDTVLQFCSIRAAASTRTTRDKLRANRPSD